MPTLESACGDDETATTVGQGGETHQVVGQNGARLTTNHGIPIADNQNSLKQGARGPVLLEDFVLREKIHHFDHERIPERVVHARGAGAHGYFELSQSLASYTTAAILTEIGVKTDVFVRFSTVAGGAGSIDTPRDVRGFAVKFYTREGNWDLVGNNIPVFFIQDAIKFPDLIHAVKMEADRGYPQAASAHDTFWDFVGLMPETTHMVMWAMSDRTLPRSYRMVEGFGVNTFRLLNRQGDAVFVKFHWRPRLGLQATCWDEAVKLAGADPDFLRRDLFEAIERGAFPQWDLGVQILTETDADAFAFDVLDATKFLPEEQYPLIIIGTLTLNRNPDNFFAETEQAAFLPTNLPPGIDFSEDPLLQGRTFSYQDTQLSRLGTVNFHQLPINQPRGCPYLNFQRDGHMQMSVPTGRASYEPNSLSDGDGGPGPRETPLDGVRSFAARFDGGKARARSKSFADHYSQARAFVQSLEEPECDHLVNALVFELSKVSLPPIRKRVLGNLRNVDDAIAARVAEGLGAALPPPSLPAVAPIDLEPSGAVRLIGKYKPTLAGRCIGVLCGDGADAGGLASLEAAVRDRGATVKVITLKIGGVRLSDGSYRVSDGQLAGSPSVFFDAIAILGDQQSYEVLAKDHAALSFVREAYVHLKAIAAVAGATPLLDAASVSQDAFILELPAGFDEFLDRAAQRNWSRERSIRTVF